MAADIVSCQDILRCHMILLSVQVHECVESSLVVFTVYVCLYVVLPDLVSCIG